MECTWFQNIKNEFLVNLDTVKVILTEVAPMKPPHTGGAAIIDSHKRGYASHVIISLLGGIATSGAKRYKWAPGTMPFLDWVYIDKNTIFTLNYLEFGFVDFPPHLPEKVLLEGF